MFAGFGLLLSGEVDQKVCHAEYRIVVVLTDHNINDFAVLFRLPHRGWQVEGLPTAIFDTAVVVGIEICKSVVLIQRVLFYIETRESMCAPRMFIPSVSGLVPI